ncbi:MAG TPA: T9SS type A sorting domain-containing protein [Saprospiraceae bacterium]|nr:T9SS type A sorting domain-containing protein [Saprospiraceae bacterium]
MVRLLFFALFYLSSLCSKAQTSFFKSYDFGNVEYIYQIIEYNERLFINTATWCGLECSFLSEVDLNGNIVWRTEIPDIDIAQGTMIIVNDTITVTGNNNENKESFRMTHFTLEGQKIGETKTIAHPTIKFTRMFQLTTQFTNNKYIICGTGKLANDAYCSIFYSVYKDGTLDTLVILDTASNISEIWESFIDSQGQLTLLLWHEEDDPGFNFRKILKLDANFNIVWSYQTENSNSNITVPRSCELLNGHTVFSFIGPEGDPFLHSIRAIDNEGELDWQYDYQWTGSRTREIYRLKRLSNGDIMGSGQYSEFEQNPRVGDSPWLFKMNASGDLLWEHIYYDFDSTLNQNGSSRLGTLLDFVELENGDIITVGTIRYNNSDMLIMRLDSNGCLFEEYCSETNVITGIDESYQLEKQLSIYPNPVSDIINIELKTRDYPLNFEIIDLTGVILFSGEIKEDQSQINVSNLNDGFYFISLKDDLKKLYTKKFIKI